ncbi:hypothetical protein M3Y94_01262700 [Aphelenchoides besseyi]|nr:hypothetical protein M3Y94_01262700 [Aphelenchoides besseyi]KAI6222559.1 Peptidase S28 domain containing protein, protein [Aphelenchoides besseyi]
MLLLSIAQFYFLVPFEMTSEIKTSSVQLDVDSDDSDSPSFELKYYSYHKFEKDETPSIILLLDRDFNSSLLTDESHSWVQLAKNLKSALFAVELRGYGESKLPKDDKSGESMETNLNDVITVVDAVVDVYGPRKWILVGFDFGGTLAIWTLVTHQLHFPVALAVNPDLSQLKEYNGKKFEDYKPSNLIISTKADQLEETQKFFDGQKTKNVVVIDEKKNDEVLSKLLEMC